MANKRSAGKEHIGAYIPTDLRKGLKAKAARLGLNETGAIITAIREWLDRNDPETTTESEQRDG
jgi:hypothetical protein